MPPSSPPRLLSVDEAAERLGVSPRSLADRRWRARVGLVTTKIGRRALFRESDIDKLILRGVERLTAGWNG